MIFRQLFDAESSTYTYLLGDESMREAVLIDSVKEQVERDGSLVRELGLKLLYVLETHIHADHVTGRGVLAGKFGAQSVLSRRSGALADIFVDDGDVIAFGHHLLTVRATPGHTAGCVTYVLDQGQMAFTGDALLVRGCGRTDFQEGDPRTLFRSVREQIFTLADSTLLYPAHDYKGHTVTTVAEERRFNARLADGRTEDEFVAIMDRLGLPYPKKIDVAVPANLKGGLEP